jgi:hypothetical protein
MRWSRGLWRLWLVASLIWVGCFAVFYGTLEGFVDRHLGPDRQLTLRLGLVNIQDH